MDSNKKKDKKKPNKKKRKKTKKDFLGKMRIPTAPPERTHDSKKSYKRHPKHKKDPQYEES